MENKEQKQQLITWGLSHKEIEEILSRGQHPFMEFYFEMQDKNTINIGYSAEAGEILELEQELISSAKNFSLEHTDTVSWGKNALGNSEPVIGFSFTSYNQPLTIIKQDQVVKHFKKIINRYGADALQLTEAA